MVSGLKMEFSNKNYSMNVLKVLSIWFIKYSFKASLVAQW